MAAERNVVDFKIHNLTEEQFQELKEQGKIDPNAVYCTPDTTKERLDALETMKQDEATAVNYDNITNCLTHIPQDIKLELGGTKRLYAWTTENGTLYTDTTQAGAYDIKVYNASGQNVTPAKGTIYISSDGTYIWCDVDTISKHYRDASNDKIIDYKNSVVLKAGSKVYVPNGAGVFDAITIQDDVVTTVSYNGTCTLYYDPTTNRCFLVNSKADMSGTTDPTTTANFYNTEQNLIKRFDGSVLSYSGWSFPLCRCTTTTDGVSSIDVVFNGFGYIGSTIFALPRVKGLIPNGRNEDGSLNNTEFVSTNVVVRTLSFSVLRYLGFNGTSIGLSDVSISGYDKLTNTNRSANLRWDFCLAGVVNNGSGIFSIKQPFAAADCNDTEFIAHQAMPSEKTINLELGASGSTYTAPADGWVCLDMSNGSGTEQQVALANQTAGNMRAYSCRSISGSGISVIMPCNKGDKIQYLYTATGAARSFRFVYANGSK